MTYPDSVRGRIKNYLTWQNDNNNVKLKEFIGSDYGLYAQI